MMVFQLEYDDKNLLFNIYSLAIKVLQDKEFAIQWLKTPKTALGDKIPINLLDTEAGAREVENLLGQIECGLYS
jgi:putative toxin-antitoxin system antitoxin component (TIGR02293 family)